MISAAYIVIAEGLVPVAKVFRLAFPHVTYHQGNAKRHLLQMPVNILHINSELFLTEKVKDFCYTSLVSYLNAKFSLPYELKGFTKDDLRQLMLITQNEREKQLIRYTVYKASCMTPKKANLKFGFQGIKDLTAQIQACITSTKEICSAVSELALLQDEAVMDLTIPQEAVSSNTSDHYEMLAVHHQTESSAPGILPLQPSLDSSTSSTPLTDVVKRKLVSIRTRARRLKSKLMAQRRFLQRNVRERVNKVVQECPNIGEVIEKFVQDCSVGADAWRRTGVLTFDGNVKLKNKVTYKAIQIHLNKVYGRKFAYGTVVQLCVPRNKHRLSSKRYRGLAKVTTRRCRKGFSLRYNPDSHWSAAFYKGLNTIQYENGQNVLVLNRDDATGFRLDTLTTCKQYANPVVRNKEVLTTRTDYVNKYPSVLQTTSYNFTATTTTGEACIGVVKAIPIHQKNSAQHYSDLKMLASLDELMPIFYNKSANSPKEIDCIRVDGASDEGPAHEVVQYWWTEWHLAHNKIATLVTSRSSGSSYLNRVELQNGCLSLGHSNAFIPSTLGGSCVDLDTGHVDEAKLKYNLDLAISAYISRTDGCPFGTTRIKLVRGSNSELYQDINNHLVTFLKGSQLKKSILKNEHPDLFYHFQDVWNVRNNHMVKGLPQNYIFYLMCCYQPQCPHPRCKAAQEGENEELTCSWYPGGPLLSYLPWPSKDPNRPWGNTCCTTCKGGFCNGHYCTELVCVQDVINGDRSVVMPPSLILKENFTELCKSESPISDEMINMAAKETLLSCDEVRLWINHLKEVITNQKRGRAKAASTRQRKKNSTCNRADVSRKDNDALCNQDAYNCTTCGVAYAEDEGEFWIACDSCSNWYCASCENLAEEPKSETYTCKHCSPPHCD